MSVALAVLGVVILAPVVVVLGVIVVGSVWTAWTAARDRRP